MAKYKCKVCGYIHEGNKARMFVLYVEFLLLNSKRSKTRLLPARKRDWIETVTCTLLFMLP